MAFVDRKMFGLSFAIGEADAISRFRRGEDDLPDAELHRGVDHVVGSDRVDAVALVVRGDEDPGYGGKMNHGIEAWYSVSGFEFVEAGIARHHVEDLSGIGDVGDTIVDAVHVQRHQIQIQHAMPARDQMRHRVASRLA